jgi:hypothetical protein
MRASPAPAHHRLHMIRVAAVLLVLSVVLGNAMPPDHLYATRGVVKSIAKTALVIGRLKDRGDISFTLNGSTSLDGQIVIGSLVSVRYYDQGKAHVATAVAAQPKN